MDVNEVLQFADHLVFSHQSHIILISQDKSQEMSCFDENLYPVKCLLLEGINNINILENKGLNNEETWLNLVELYEGNPTYLNSIAILIKTIFEGKVSEFLQEGEGELILTEDIKLNLNYGLRWK